MGDKGFYSKQKKRRSLGKIGFGVVVGALFMLIVSSFFNEQTHTAKNTQEQSQQMADVTRQEQVEFNVATQITNIVDNVSESIVGVTNIQKRADFWSGDDIDEAGTGSGVIYKKDDKYVYIVTNHHVVEQADAVEIILNDDTNIEAEILGTDIFTDLAVLRAPKTEVPIEKAIEMGTSRSLKVGEPAIAIGNPLGHMFAGSVTQGIISGKQRTIPQDLNQDGRTDWQADVLQTDAAINPGNSGGALINIEGQLIGINSMKVNQAIAQGIGFAIPIDLAKPIITQLETTGTVSRPQMGVEIYSIEEVPQAEWRNTLHLPNAVTGGVYIWNIDPRSAAEAAGLRRLDVITSFDGQEVNNIVDLRKILYEEKAVGDKVDIIYYRNGKKYETTVTLEEQL